MYICVCNAVRESDLKKAVASGLSFAEFRAETNCSNTCGTCLSDAQTEYTRQNATSRPFSIPVFAYA